MHDDFGNAEAFQMRKPLPLHKWIFVMLKLTDSHAQLDTYFDGANYTHGYRFSFVSVYRDHLLFC